MKSRLTSVSCSKLPHSVMFMENDIAPTIINHVIASDFHPEPITLNHFTSVCPYTLRCGLQLLDDT